MPSGDRMIGLSSRRVRRLLTTGIVASLAGACGSSDGGIVRPATPSSVTVTLASSTLQVGQTTQATAVVRGSTGVAISGATVSWSSTGTPGSASVSAAGLVTAVAPGSVTITATASEGTAVAGSASLTINPVPLPPTLSTVTPTAIDGAFGVLRLTLKGARFTTGATSVGVTVGSIVSTSTVVVDSTTITSDFTVPFVTAQAAGTISVTTAAGTSTPLAFTVFPVGAAPLQLGTPNGDPNDGTPYTSDCPTGSIATGIVGTSATSLTSLALSCQQMSARGVLSGTAVLSQRAGMSIGDAFSLSCPGGSILVGLTGRVGLGGGGPATGLNDMISGVCASLTVAGSTSATANAGGNFAGSTAYSSLCPHGLALIGLEGRAVPSINQTRIRCR